MQIVMFSINPLFPDRVMGGAPKQLQKIAVHLGRLGHDVTVLCTQAKESAQPFRWGDTVQVKPILRFKQPFPQPYAAPAYDIANAFHDVAAHLQTADRFYMHDGEYLFPFAYQAVPTVVSLRDNVYPETLLGGFLFQGDTLIAISDYSRRLYQATMGRFFPDFAARLHVVPNGIDWDRFRPVDGRALAARLGVDPARQAIILHPHRPEPSKGLPQTIAVADRLRHQHGLTNLRVLVPRWLDSGQSPEVRDFMQAMIADIAARGLSDHIIFHDWVTQAEMPAYYSLGGVTLALGHFVESFGNTPYESLGCGTPAVVSRVATHRELLPDALLDKVHFDDNDHAAALAAAILRDRRRTSPDTLAYLHTHYPVEKQLDGYANAILNAARRGPLAYAHQPRRDSDRYALAPWCYRSPGGIYHDFLAAHRRLPGLEALLDAHRAGFTAAAAAARGVSAATLEQWLRAGYLVSPPL